MNWGKMIRTSWKLLNRLRTLFPGNYGESKFQWCGNHFREVISESICPGWLRVSLLTTLLPLPPPSWSSVITISPAHTCAHRPALGIEHLAGRGRGERELGTIDRAGEFREKETPIPCRSPLLCKDMAVAASVAFVPKADTALGFCRLRTWPMYMQCIYQQASETLCTSAVSDLKLLLKCLEEILITPLFHFHMEGVDELPFVREEKGTEYRWPREISGFVCCDEWLRLCTLPNASVLCFPLNV